MEKDKFILHKKRFDNEGNLKEFNLSEKRIDTGSRMWPSGKYSYDEEDVKEFIRLLKSPRNTVKNAKDDKDGTQLILISYGELDKLAGDEFK